ncbi:hypothetical protein ACOSQ2_015762 [Xanthoceras sorbifolium]
MPADQAAIYVVHRKMIMDLMAAIRLAGKRETGCATAWDVEFTTMLAGWSATNAKHQRNKVMQSRKKNLHRLHFLFAILLMKIITIRLIMVEGPFSQAYQVNFVLGRVSGFIVWCMVFVLT